MNTSDPDSPRELASFADELMANVLVGQLAERGIKATSVGGFVSGFRAEAPGAVSVMVRQADLTAAQEIWESLQ